MRDEGRKTFVPIWIGPAEAVSIQWELDNRQPQRPMTHDLINNIFNELDIHYRQSDGKRRVRIKFFYATLHLQLGRNGDSIREVDARPSDAIALALRAHCQILVSDSVAQKTAIQIEETEELESVGTVPRPKHGRPSPATTRSIGL